MNSESDDKTSMPSHEVVDELKKNINNQEHQLENGSNTNESDVNKNSDVGKGGSMTSKTNYGDENIEKNGDNSVDEYKTADTNMEKNGDKLVECKTADTTVEKNGDESVDESKIDDTDFTEILSGDEINHSGDAKVSTGPVSPVVHTLPNEVENEKNVAGSIEQQGNGANTDVNGISLEHADIAVPSKETDSVVVQETTIEDDQTKTAGQGVASGSGSGTELRRRSTRKKRPEGQKLLEPFLDQPSTVVGPRTRTASVRFQSPITPKRAERQIVIVAGNGMALGDIGTVAANIDGCMVENHSNLKRFHRLIFGVVGGISSLKGNIKRFSGFNFDESSPEYVKKIHDMKGHTLEHLRDMLELLDLSSQGKKELLITNLMKFLLRPFGDKEPRAENPYLARLHDIAETQEARARKSARGKSYKESDTDSEDERRDNRRRQPASGSRAQSRRRLNRPKRRRLSRSASPEWVPSPTEFSDDAAEKKPLPRGKGKRKTKKLSKRSKMESNVDMKQDESQSTASGNEASDMSAQKASGDILMPAKKRASVRYEIKHEVENKAIEENVPAIEQEVENKAIQEIVPVTTAAATAMEVGGIDEESATPQPSVITTQVEPSTTAITSSTVSVITLAPSASVSETVPTESADEPAVPMEQDCNNEEI